MHLEEARALIWPRWSPDGDFIASLPIFPSANLLDATILLVDPESGATRVIPGSPQGSALTALTWSGNGEALVYSQPMDRSTIAGGAQVVYHELDSSEVRPLAYLRSIGSALDVRAGGTLIVSLHSTKAGLREVPMGGSNEPGRWLSHGGSFDRQPIYAPDGEGLLFSSDRGGNLDLWMVSRGTGTVRRLTDHPAVDWDPALSADGQQLLWSSDRGGNFEIWIAEADGRNPRQVTRDGSDAENPTITPDGRWIVYNSSHPEKVGVWKIHPDGTGAERLAEGVTGLPEVSPTGKYAVYSLQVTPNETILKVVELEDSTPVPFEITCDGRATTVLVEVALGRARWLPDESGIAFLCVDEAGTLGLFTQDFVPGRDTSSTRRLLAELDGGSLPESFGFSSDGRYMTYSALELVQDIEVIENLPGIERPRPR